MASDWQTRIVADQRLDRAAWFRARKNYVTASEVPAILGLDRKSAAAVLRDKLTPELQPELMIAQIEAGRHLEQGVLDWYLADVLPDELHRGGVLVVAPSSTYLAATPDAVLGGEPIEIKCAMWSSRPNWHLATRNLKGWPRSFPIPRATQWWIKEPPIGRISAQADPDDPAVLWRAATRHMLLELLPRFGPPEAPIKYWVQLQVQLHVLGADVGHIVALQAGATRYDLTYAADAAFQTWMLDRLAGFYKEWKSRL